MPTMNTPGWLREFAPGGEPIRILLGQHVLNFGAPPWAAGYSFRTVRLDPRATAYAFAVLVSLAVAIVLGAISMSDINLLACQVGVFEPLSA